MKNKRQAQHGEIKMRKRLMSKHFNYGVKYKMKGNICLQISLKVTFVWSVQLVILYSCPVWYSPLYCLEQHRSWSCQHTQHILFLIFFILYIEYDCGYSLNMLILWLWLFQSKPCSGAAVSSISPLFTNCYWKHEPPTWSLAADQLCGLRFYCCSCISNTLRLREKHQ